KDGKLVTDLGMEYGRTKFDIEGGGREHDARIRSQNSTLAVRGTRVSLYDQPPFAPEAISFTGVARFQDPKKQLAFGSNRVTKISAAADSAADLSLASAVVDPSSPLARSASEDRLVQQLVSRGANTFFDPNRGIRVISGGTVPSNLADISRGLSGLTIFASWKSNTNFDLGVTQ